MIQTIFRVHFFFTLRNLRYSSLSLPDKIEVESRINLFALNYQNFAKIGLQLKFAFRISCQYKRNRILGRNQFYLLSGADWWFQYKLYTPSCYRKYFKVTV